MHTTPYPRILSKVFTEPWEILPSVHQSLATALLDHVRSGRELTPPQDRAGLGSDRGSDRFLNPVQISEEHGIAILTIEGVLGKRLSWIESMCGGCDLAWLDHDIEELSADDRIETVIFDMDTPGGLAYASADTAERILELSEKKKTIAYTDTLMASAGYKLAAACREIHSAKGAEIGSIGTMIALVDSSAAYEMDGLELRLFRDGKYKALGMPGKPVTEDEAAYLQDQVDGLSARFKQFVRDRRPGVSDDTMQGQTFDGATAKQRRLVDENFRDLTDLVASLL